MVKDINPVGSANPVPLTGVNGVLFFSADDGVHGYELWRSDGTEVGTYMVKDVFPGSGSATYSGPSYGPAANVGGTLFFAADDGVRGRELWKSDGTATGTVLVKDINPGEAGSGPEGLANVNGTLFFRATDGPHAVELWKSDGTAAGTVMVKDICPGGGNASPSEMTGINGTVFFAAEDGGWGSGGHGRELWKSDGTEEGTLLVNDIAPGGDGSSPGNLTDFNGTLFFSAADQLWKSDGTEAGTVVVKDPCPDGFADIRSLTAVDDTLFFSAKYQLWKSDGTPGGTVMVKDMNPEGYSEPYNLTNFDGTLFFRSNDGTHGWELWKSDGSADGTVMVRDINPGGDSQPTNLTVVDHVLYFDAYETTHRNELWKSDGTADGTVLVKDIHPTSDSDPNYLINVDSTLFFSANEGIHGRELWALAKPPYQLTVTKQAAPSPVYAGGPMTYTIGVTNTGRLTLTATISDVLPAQVTTAQPVSWSSVIIAPGGTWTKRFVVTVTQGYSGTLTNVVQASTVEGAAGVYTNVVSARRPDLIPTGLEVNQAIQSVTNTVTLVEGKRTYVRFHVKTDGGVSAAVPAWLSATRAGSSLGVPLLPQNPNAVITVTANPDRGKLEDSFYFELPAAWLSGTLTLVATVNPGRAIAEGDYQNDVSTTTVTFRPTPPFTVTVVGITYAQAGITYTAQLTDYVRLASWLRTAYPIAQLNMITRTLIYASGPPTATNVNQRLALMYAIDTGRADQCPGSRYYGMVHDGGGFVRGKAVGIPGCIASGPTGNPAPRAGVRWDTDGSYGDWYAGHELGHTLGRFHTLCDGSEGGPDVHYPYHPTGKIGGPYYGFNVETLAIYTPTLWTDIMTYCEYNWMSGYTYEGIRTRLISETTKVATSAALVAASADGYLLVWGEMNLTRDTAQLGTLYRLPGLIPSNRPATSVYTLRLLDGSDSLLAEYPFAPKEDTQHQAGEDLTAVIYEIVPYAAGTVRIVVAHGGAELTSRSVSVNPPQVTVLSPNGGETLGQQATATWSGSDPDGGLLTYALLYSADGGVTWTTIATEIAGTCYTFPTDELAGSDLGRIRVLVSDGVNTAFDDSDGNFHLPRKAPTANIISPGSGESYLSEQTVVLYGEAYDREDGTLNGPALVWLSSLDGTLGTGRLVAVTGLSIGKHTITLRATDSDAMSGTATINLHIQTRGHYLYLPLVLRNYAPVPIFFDDFSNPNSGWPVVDYSNVATHRFLLHQL